MWKAALGKERLEKKQTAGLNSAAILQQKGNNRRSREKEGEDQAQRKIPLKLREEPFIYVIHFQMETGWMIFLFHG
ncbi:hypothetical protein ACFX13_038816 [Malus domestica]